MMEERSELVTSLRQLAHWATKTAGLLEQTTLIPEVNFMQVLDSIPSGAAELDVSRKTHWPKTIQTPKVDFLKPIGHFNKPGLRVLEYHRGSSEPLAKYIKWDNSRIDLLTSGFSDELTKNVRIVSSLEVAKEHYDVILIAESLEFVADPIRVLSDLKQKLRKDGKMYIRFRPWSSQNGGFQHTYFPKAFAHLVMDLEHNSDVQFKVIRPLATYEQILSGAGLAVISRSINSVKLDEYLNSSQVIMDTIIARAWQRIRIEDALAILATDSVDYTVIA